MKVLLIHQAYADDRQPGGTRHFELLKRLAAQGHEVTVVTGDHCYLSGHRLPRKRNERYCGINIRRTATLSTLGRGLPGKVASYLSFMITAFWAGMRSPCPDVVIGSSPAMFQLLPAWLVARARRRPFVLEIRDLWPAFAVDMGVLRSRVIIRLAERVERFFYNQATRIVVNSPAYVEYISDLGVPRAKLELIPNGVDPAALTSTACVESTRAEFHVTGKFVVSYVGTLGLANDVDTLLATARELANNEQIHLLIVGDGLRKPDLEQGINEFQLKNVTLAGSVTKERVADVLAASHACLATLRDIPMFRMTYPNKVFDYMAAGRPIVLAMDGVIRDVVEQANGGICVPPGDATAIADAIRYLHQHPEDGQRLGKSARDYVTRHFHRDDHAIALDRTLRQAVFVKNTVPPRQVSYGGWPKRLLDVVSTSLLAILLSPVFLFVALLVLFSMGRPVLFVDRRGGWKGRTFGCLKFRTMLEKRDANGVLLPDESRRTAVGDWLRATSLDELPQLWNVLRGDMSLVGPRPLTCHYLDRYTAEQSRRHDVRPGITGWAQVNGRTSIPWEQKFALDLWYVENMSVWLDLRILLVTCWQLLGSRGDSTAESLESEFLGTSSQQA